MAQRQRGTLNKHDVCIVGAGAAGVGLAIALKHAGVEDVVLLDRHGVGASFERWPKETRLLTPSFPTNSIGMLDLNSTAIGTSPAYTLQREHPSGRAFAQYLQVVAEHFELQVTSGCDVLGLEHDGEGFRIVTNQGPRLAQFVVWAAGEFQYPRTSAFPGAQLCRHSSTLATFRDCPDEDVVVIGGYESGLDAAIHLTMLGKRVTLLSRGTPWGAMTPIRAVRSRLIPMSVSRRRCRLAIG